jgi:hypothetical protein
MVDLKEQRICVKFCFKLGKTASETHEMLKTVFGVIDMGRTQTFDWFSRFIRGGKIRSKILSVQVAQTKTWRMFAKSSTKTNETHYQDSKQVRPLVWNMPAHSEDFNMQRNSGAQCFVCAAIFGG